MKKIMMFIISCVFYAFPVYADSVKIKYFQTDIRYEYRIRLLELALEKTIKTHGKFSLVPAFRNATQDRGLLLLERKEIDVVFLPTTKEREQRFLPVRIPIMAGILGYRVFIVRKNDLEKFSGISSLEELNKRFRAGFGSQWADMKILQDNGIDAAGSSTYENLFAMLSACRFDYFPRGINEAWQEIDDKKTMFPDLAVENALAFYYPYPVYYFTHKSNTALASRIETGLKDAQEDGSFRQLFLRYHADTIRQAELSKRKIFRLHNNTLPEGTPEPDTSWWMPENSIKNRQKTYPTEK